MWQGLRRLHIQIAVSVPPLVVALTSPAFAADPFASNNGLYPDQSQWQGTYRSLNYDYPETVENKWFAVAPRAPLMIDNADEYVAALKAFVEPSMKGMIDAADTWDPTANGWYGMIWQGDGTKGPNGVTDPESGQESILGAFSGQVITKETFVDPNNSYPPLTVDMQNPAFKCICAVVRNQRLVMPKETPFSAVTRKMLDAWLQTDPDQPKAPDIVYRDIIDMLSIKMRLTVFSIAGDDPLLWQMKAIRHSGFTSRIINFNRLFADCHIGEFKDQTYMREAVIPRLQQVLDSQQPSMELVKTRLLGVNLGYDRILLPQRNAGRPEWIISSTYAQFLLSPPQRQEKLDVADEAIVQLLIEGATAKEIAIALDVSHRTVEHRLERMKERYGARNTVHLVAMLIATHMDRSHRDAGEA